MKTYFVCSDIHGFYKEWMLSLSESGFDVDNNEHILIILGDIFDRGKQPWQVYKFITSLSQERVVLVKGNHEYLLLELVERKYYYEHDVLNGTYGTLVSLYKDPFKVRDNWLRKNAKKDEDIYNDYDLYKRSRIVLREAFAKLFDNKKINEIVEWLNSSKWKNYYELGKYIFVHSFIPVKKIDGVRTYYPEWRKKSTDAMWFDALWRCPYEDYQAGYFKDEEKNGKILVSGHWHTSDFYNNLLFENEPDKRLSIKKNPIFRSEQFPGLIGIDTCTAITKKVNVLVINENEL